MDEKKKSDEPQFSTKIKQLISDYEGEATRDMKKQNENKELDALLHIRNERDKTRQRKQKRGRERKKRSKPKTSSDAGSQDEDGEDREGSEDADSKGSDSTNADDDDVPKKGGKRDRKSDRSNKPKETFVCVFAVQTSSIYML